jgi:hypothetical protein
MHITPAGSSQKCLVQPDAYGYFDVYTLIRDYTKPVGQDASYGIKVEHEDGNTYADVRLYWHNSDNTWKIRLLVGDKYGASDEVWYSLNTTWVGYIWLRLEFEVAQQWIRAYWADMSPEAGWNEISSPTVKPIVPNF